MIVKAEEGKPIIVLLKTGEFTILTRKTTYVAFDPDHPDTDPNILKYSTLWGSIDNHFKTNNFTHRDAPYQTRDPTPSTFPRRNNTGNRKVIDQFFTPGGWTRWSNDPLVLIDHAIGNAKVVRRFTFKKLIVLIIDTAHIADGDIRPALQAPIRSAPNGFVKFKEALEKIDLLDLVGTKDKCTLFVPADGTLCDNGALSKEELISPLKNHFFFGRIVFTPLFPSARNATVQSGGQFEFSFENSTHYVSCGKAKTLVPRGGVIPQNGVIHACDRQAFEVRVKLGP
ncbi:hypothetical protein FRC11_003570 [Ceratobasidium sp. 423]|nr:hypothetical protein FRC11_003570 [Ceratobasidium sp. 423]